MPDEYSSKQEDLESSESDLDLGMYQPPDVADDDSSMDSMGKYFGNQYLWVPRELIQIIFSEQNKLIQRKHDWNCFSGSALSPILNLAPPIPAGEGPHTEP